MASADPSDRRAEKPLPTSCPVTGDGQAVPLRRVSSFAAAREVLRARNSTIQAGFTAEFIPSGIFHHRPILIADGPEHDERRRLVARFFAPKVLQQRHGERLHEAAAEVIAQHASTAGHLVVDDAALLYTVTVTAEIVGLTASNMSRMARRLEKFFRQPALDRSRKDLGRSRKQWMQAAWRGVVPLVGFYFADVLPAIRQHRRNPRPDVITHLLDEGCTRADILVECVTYGTAGMVTTREFITMATWHLLDRPELAARFVVAESAERGAILAEIIRLEPPVGHLYRRMTADLSPHQTGDLVDLDIRSVNTDPEVMGENPLQLCPGRDLPKGVGAVGMTFGDGAHACPGQHLALMEAGALILEILRQRPEIISEPVLSWDDLIEGYKLRGLTLRLGAV